MKYFCKECGKEVTDKDLHYICAEKLINEQLCFDCDYWSEKLQCKDSAKSVRINGEQYWLAEEHTVSPFRGFDGQKFIILFNNGKQIITTNLWYNGAIPEGFKSRLPNNAQFLTIQNKEK